MTPALHRSVPRSLAAGFAVLLFLLGAPLPAQTSPTAIPLSNPGFEEGTPGGAPQGWAGTIAPRPGTGEAPPGGYSAINDPDSPRAGKASVRLEAPADRGGPPFGVVSGMVEATPYRGKRLRFTGAVRVRPEPGGKAGLWMRVDRPERRMGFFDNMEDRPIRSERWADYVVEGDVAADAERIVFGLLLSGAGAAWMDEVRLEVVGPARSAGGGQLGPQRPRDAPGPGDIAARPLSARGLANLEAFARLYGYVRWFHPSDEAAAADWDSLALAGVERVEGARNSTELAGALETVFRPVAPSLDVFLSRSAPPDAAGPAPRPSAETNAVRWRHWGMGEDRGGIYRSLREEVPDIAPADILVADLGAGVSARLPMALWRAPGSATLPAADARSVAPAKPEGFTPSGFDRTSRLAAIVVGWNLFQHFYPYFDAVEVDWPAELGKGLRAAAIDPDDLAFHRTLRRLVAALDDGHGAVRYFSENGGLLPVAWEMVEGELAVTAAMAGTPVAPGEIVTHVGGVPAAKAIAAGETLHSGSPQWTRWRALQELRAGKPGSRTEIRVRGSDGKTRNVELAFEESAAARELSERKPDVIAELEPGILYVDLDRVTDEQLRARETEIAAARALVFDLRGYPRGTPWYLSRLSDRPLRSAAMNVPVYTRPNREGVTYQEGGWNMPPGTPRFPANLVFITDGRAISYAESVLGVIKGNGIAEIVGEPSAGANGNVSAFLLPGGYRVAWTAMRVVNRDGSPHHVVGVTPTVPASRTLAGLRAGRDELLEKAVAVAKARMPK